MTVTEFSKLLIPPKKLAFTGSPAEWKEAEKQLRTPLPQDYKWFVAQFGDGNIDELNILNPFTTNPHKCLDFSPDSKAAVLLEELRMWRKSEFSADFPFPAFPEPGGLLPCASWDRVTIYWQTMGEPDGWKIVVEDQLAITEVKLFNESLTSFLHGILSGRIRHRAFKHLRSMVPIQMRGSGSIF